ncbi:MAG: addiction module antidote protein [Bacteriovorax sp.]
MNKIKPYVSFHDAVVEELRTNEESQFLYLKASFEDNDDCPEAILMAIRHVAEARGFKSFAEKAQLNRENLYRVLSRDGNPRFDTFLKIIDALGLQISIKAKKTVEL